MWDMSVFKSYQIMYPCILKVSGCEEEVCDRVKRTAAKGAKSTCGTRCHQLNNGNEIFPSEDVSCGRFWSIISVHAGDLPFSTAVIGISLTVVVFSLNDFFKRNKINMN